MIYTYSVYGVVTAFFSILLIRAIFKINLRRSERDLFYRQALESLGLEANTSKFNDLLAGNPHYDKILHWFDTETPKSFQEWLNKKHRKNIETNGAYRCAVILKRVIEREDLDDREFRSVFAFMRDITELNEESFLSLFNSMKRYAIDAGLIFPLFIDGERGDSERKMNEWKLEWSKPQYMRDSEKRDSRKIVS